VAYLAAGPAAAVIGWLPVSQQVASKEVFLATTKNPRTTDKQVIHHEHFPFGTVLMQWEKNFIQKITAISDSEQLQVDMRMSSVRNIKGKRKQKKKHLK
jgi:hypothetical protein